MNEVIGKPMWCVAQHNTPDGQIYIVTTDGPFYAVAWSKIQSKEYVLITNGIRYTVTRRGELSDKIIRNPSPCLSQNSTLDCRFRTCLVNIEFIDADIMEKYKKLHEDV